ncbi:MAG: adenylate/guanylate cyclase domain-containing protein [Alphaproteobacteria bacterium]|nr:adenylate/guanylate cyclase domain-containing protein [Alphaproteobacteria bacterium]
MADNRTPEQRLRSSRLYLWGYLASMALPALIQLAFDFLFTVARGDLLALLGAGWLGLAIFGVVGLGGAWVLHRPIDRYLKGEGELAPAIRRTRKITFLSAFWIMALSVVHGSINIGAVAAMAQRNAGGTIDAAVLVLFQAWYILLTTYFFGFLTYFLIDSRRQYLKHHLFDTHGVTIPPDGVSLWTRLAVTGFTMSILPAAMIALDVLYFLPIRQAHGLDLLAVILIDIGLVLVTAPVSVYFVGRGVTRSVELLLAAQDKVRAGDLTARAPVVGDDETGRLTMGFNAMVAGLEERQFVRETLGRYVPEAVAERILKDRGRLAADVREATILFTDIDGFTTLSEAMAPAEVIALVNDYLAAVMEPIRRHGGTIQNFIGDSVFVSFNLPVEDANHAANAIACARDIQRAVAERDFGGGRHLSTRIGINTGPVVAGNVGTADRAGYTVLGDAVNLAARVEQLNKQFGTRVLVTEATMRAAGEGFRFHRVGTVPVRGRAEAATLYAVE